MSHFGTWKSKYFSYVTVFNKDYKLKHVFNDLIYLVHSFIFNLKKNHEKGVINKVFMGLFVQ